MSDPPLGRSLFETIVGARMQVLQSKRLLLALHERRFRTSGADAQRMHAQRLRSETQVAQEVYRNALLKWGTPERPDYWPVAYGELIGLADNLAHKLREATIGSDAPGRFELAVEVEGVDELIDQWRKSLRSTMASALV